jgi:hypothetical protein
VPKSHFPLRGGSHPPSWSSGLRSHSAGPASGHGASSSGSGKESRQCQALEAEVQRLRQELARARNSSAGGNASHNPMTNGMLWISLAICGGGLLFAVLALLYHG